MKTLVTGGTGLVGRRLVNDLDDAVILSRDPGRYRSQFPGRELRHWQPLGRRASPDLLGDAEVVVNLAGEPIADGRWTVARMQQIRDSRVSATRNLVAGLGKMEHKPSVLINASAVGFYGDRGDETLDEDSASGTGFLAKLCSAWEAEALEAEQLGIRVVCLRFGVVLAQDGGALAKMLPPFKLGVGGRLGSGQQWMPWLHIDDAVGLVLHAIGDASMRGVVNAVAPQPVTNSDFTRALGETLRRPTLMSVPKLALQLGLGAMSEVLLASQLVVPKRALEHGYYFRYPELTGALAALLEQRGERKAA